MHTVSLWLSLAQIAVLFGVNKPAISKHLKNIYTSKELDRQATVSKMDTVQNVGGRNVRRHVEWILFLRILDEKEHREEQEADALGLPCSPKPATCFSLVW